MFYAHALLAALFLQSGPAPSAQPDVASESPASQLSIVATDADPQEARALTPEEQTWLAEHRALSVGVDSSWYPFEYISADGVFSGIAADYLKHAGETLDLRFRPVRGQAWSQAFAAFKLGEIDILSAIIRTQERAALHFTEPYFVAPTVIVTRKNAFYAENMESLAGRRLGLVRGFAIVDLVRRDYPDIEIVLVDSIIDGLEALNAGTFDAYLGAISVVNYEIAQGEFGNLLIAGFSPYRFEISMAVREGLEPLVGILNKTFAGMSERQKAAIANDWLAIHVQTGTDIQSVLFVALPVLAVLIGIIVIVTRYNRSLRSEVARRRAVEAELTRLAQLDVLTGLPNRRRFHDLSSRSLHQAAREGRQQAVLFVDIDGFKQVNDTYGHVAGDALLSSVAERLRACVSAKDTVARMGGDEFMIHLIDGADHRPDSVADRLVESMGKPFELDEGVITIGASVGVAHFPADGNDVETLIRKADAAMYAAKKSGKNAWRRFENELPDNA